MKLKKAKFTKTLVMVLLLFLFCACSAKSPRDILTQEQTEAGKIQLTISPKYAVDLNDFEEAVEMRFSNLDLIQVGNYTSNYSDEYAQRLANDDLTDIIVTWPLDKAAQDCGDRLIDLSGLEFTSNYMISMLNDIAQDGKLYYLPGPTQIRGIVLNKTLFKENGWKIPTNFEEFVTVCREIEASGIRSLQLSFWNHEVLLYAFEGFAYSESFSSPRAIEAVQNYNQGEGSLQDFALPAFDVYERLIAEGIFKPEDLDIRYPMREKMFFQRECAMMNEAFAINPKKMEKANFTDELAFIPFFCPGKENSWGHIIPYQYIGLNGNLQKRGNEEKHELALQIMDFISTPEGQAALGNYSNTMFSSLIDNDSEVSADLIYMRETIENGRCVTFPTFENSDEALYQALAAMLRGEINRDEAIALVDAANQNPIQPEEASVIGVATETFSLTETGNYVTDVLRKRADTDFALFLDNGKDGTYNARGISAKFYKGDILESDVTLRVLPVLQHGETGYLNIAVMTGANLINALEYTLDDGDWFYYCSGLQMNYDPTAEPGSRIKKITDSQGQGIQPEKQYTVAIMEGSVDDDYITSLETTEILIKDLIISDIQEKGTITPD